LRPLLTACVFVVVGLTACGGDDSTNDSAPAGSTMTTSTAKTTAAAKTREQFIVEGDAFCKRIDGPTNDIEDRFERAQRSAENDPSAQLEAVAPVLADDYRLQRVFLREWEAIEPPSGDETVKGRLDDEISQQVALIGRLADAAEDGDFARFSSLADETKKAVERKNRLYQGYGFKICGSG
jgi:hypothetical protein